MAAIRAHRNRWTFADATGDTLSDAIRICFDRAAKVFPGLHGISYKSKETMLLVDISGDEDQRA